MIQVGKKHALAFHQALIGQTVSIMVEDDGCGYTPTYVSCRVDGANEGEEINVMITGADENGVWGTRV